MHHIIDTYNDRQWRTLQNVASQIAGRKPKRTQYDLKIPREMQDRRRQSPFKDIASNYRRQVSQWVRDDGEHNQHQEMDGGSLSNALRHTLHVAHHVYQRDMHAHRTGGGLGDLIEDAGGLVNKISDNVKEAVTDAPSGLRRIGDTLENTARATGVQADIMGDKFLHEIGIRKHKKYESAAITGDIKLHSLLNQEVYKKDRGDVAGWSYLNEDSTNDYGVWSKDGEAMFVFRGTDPSKAMDNKDLVDDARIATGTTLELTTNKSARDKMMELFDRFGDHKVNTSGYSLGGGRQLQLLNDSAIYKRLGDKSYTLAPGVTALNPNLKKYASYDKMHYVYAHNDMVANSLLAHKNDNHSVLYDYADPLKAHLFLKDID